MARTGTAPRACGGVPLVVNAVLLGEVAVHIRVVLTSLVRRGTVEPVKEYAKSRFQGEKCRLV